MFCAQRTVGASRGTSGFSGRRSTPTGSGTNADTRVGIVADFDFFRLHHTAYYRLRPALYAGAGLYFDNHTGVGPGEGEEPEWTESPYVTYSQAHGLPLDSQIAAGTSLDLLWDNRDSFINADRGWLAQGQLSNVVRRLPGRRFELAEAHAGRANLRERRRAIDVIGLAYLGVRRSRRRRRGAVFRFALDGWRRVWPLRAWIRRRPVPRRTARLRRDRVPGNADAEWAAWAWSPSSTPPR